MKKVAGCLFLLLCTATAWAQTTFERAYGNTGSDLGLSVDQTSDGGYILSGLTSQAGDGGDMLLVRVDQAGEVLWTSTFGTDAIDIAYSVKQTGEGGYIVSGVFQGFQHDTLTLLRIDPNGDLLWQGDYPGPEGRSLGYAVRPCTDGGFVVCGTAGYALDDAYFVRTNAQGDLLWSRTIDLGGAEMALAIEQLDDGGFAAMVQNSDVGDPDGELYVLRLDAQGDTLWSHKIETPGPDEACGFALTDDGGFIVAGGNGYPERDMLIVRLDGQGQELWRRILGSPGQDDLAMAIHAIPGDYAIAGRQEDPAAGNIGMYLARLDLEGNLLWERRFDRGVFAEANDMVPTLDGGFALLGSTVEILDENTAFAQVYLVKTNDQGLTAVEELSIPDQPLLLYPNPASSELTILREGRERGTITVHDALGKTVITEPVITTPVTIRVDQLAPGCYSMVLTTEVGRIGSGRFIVQRE